MTYRTAVQIQIKALQEIYDNMGYLRDKATMEDKEGFDYVRRHLPAVWGALQKVDNETTIPDHKLKGDYSIKVLES